jgi:3-hydroxypropanoate dehydrogenase
MPYDLALDDRHTPLSDHALDQLFREARTFYSWEDRDIPDADLKALYELMKFGPTSANQSPARFVFLRGEAQKRLKPHLIESNVDKTMTAPVTVVVAWDWKFHEKIPQLFPHSPEARDWFEAEDSRKENGFRNGTLQGAYLILAARALGIDSGGMSGFDKAGVDKEFFEGDPEMKHWRSNFLINLGYGTEEKLFPRLPRLAFDEAAKILK